MVSFSCEGCGDILTKKKLDPHRNQCYGASFTCIDCMVHFQGNDYRSHTSCMTEAEKYQGHLYRGEKKGKGGQKKPAHAQEQAVVPHKAETNQVATVDVLPRAPTPPASGAQLPPGVNIFDYMDTPKALPSTKQDGDDKHYETHGYSYGTAPIGSGDGRYASQTSLAQTSYVTPAPKRHGEPKSKESKSDKKRKRDDQDMAEATPALHSGLTGGMDRMLTGPDFGHGDAIAPSPLSPKKRSKKDKSDSKESAKQVSISDKTMATTADARDDKKQMVTYRSPAELFMSFVNKGPDSERGLSINKALKRYHRERQTRGDKDDGDKDLWKGLRIRKNERGEIVLFI